MILQNREYSSQGRLPTYMLSAVIHACVATQHVLLAQELVHQRHVFYGPLVLTKNPFNTLTPGPDMDRTVSRRSEPSSCAALMGEQPNP